MSTTVQMPGVIADHIAAVNAFDTEAIVDSIRRDGRIFLSSTMLDGRFTLRMAALGLRTHRRTIDLAIQILREHAGMHGPK